MADDRKAPPLKTRLYWSSLTNNEKSVLDAMYEHCWNGSIVWAALPRLAAYCKLSRKTVQRVLHGDPRQEKSGLIRRGIVTQLAPANRGKKRPATYRINPDALADDPQMEQYKRRQGILPGIRRVAAPGEPIESPTMDPRSIVPQPNYGPTVQGTTDRRSTDSFKPDSLLNSKPLTHHGDAALNSLPAWRAFKEQLRSEISDAEWNLWVRPMLLLKTMSASADQKHLLAALPPNSQIQSAAINRLPMMRELLAPGGMNISLTRYPDEWEIEEAKKRYDVDMAPKPWTRET